MWSKTNMGYGVYFFISILSVAFSAQTESPTVSALTDRANNNHDSLKKSFKATGCPNNFDTYQCPTSKCPNTNWWKTQPKIVVFKDMMTYCTLVKDGIASDAQKAQCCGAKFWNRKHTTTNCRPTTCVEQNQWIDGNKYVLTFQATGCPNEDPDIDWWMKQTNPTTVFKDMMVYCNRVKDGYANPKQMSTCCGGTMENPEKCKPTTCAEQEEWKEDTTS